MKKTIHILLLIFCLSSLLFPEFIYNKICFLLIMGISIAQKGLYKNTPTLSPIFIFCVFLYGFIVSFFTYSNPVLSKQFMLSVSVLFMIYPISYYKINIDSIVKISGVTMVIITWLLYFGIIMIKSHPWHADLEMLFSTMSGTSAWRNFGKGVFTTFEFGTMPFLILSASLFFISYMNGKKIVNLACAVAMLLTILLSGSRASTSLCLLSLCLIFFLCSSLNKKITFLLIVVPILTYYVTSFISQTTMFDASEKSNSIKIGHISSFFNQLNIITFFTGKGLGSYYYSSGREMMTAHTEITPMDMLRYFGFILTGILYAVMIFPIRKIKRYSQKNILYSLIFGLFLLLSCTNPIMFNSYGLFIVLWYWSKIIEENYVTNQSQNWLLK